MGAKRSNDAVDLCIAQAPSNLSEGVDPVLAHNATTSLLGFLNSPFAPSKIQLDGPSRTAVEPASLSNEAARQLLGLLTGRPAQKDVQPEVQEQVDTGPASTLAQEEASKVSASTEQPRKPSPFTFVSPFDTLAAMTAKGRASSSPAVSLGAASPSSNRSASHLPLLPKSSEPSTSVLVQDVHEATPALSEHAAPIPEGLADQAEVQEEAVAAQEGPCKGTLEQNEHSEDVAHPDLDAMLDEAGHEPGDTNEEVEEENGSDEPLHDPQAMEDQT